MITVAYRHAAYDSPWWVIPSTRDGRFNRAYDSEPTQYLALHPLGPTAELLRQQLRGPDLDRADTLLANVWAVLIDTDGCVDISFGNCAADYGISPHELVGDDYGPTQVLATHVRNTGIPGFTVPSAALPGTNNLILFGARVSNPYGEDPVTPDECPTGHVSDGARPAREVLPLVRWKGAPHSALDTWAVTGEYRTLDDPLAVRW